MLSLAAAAPATQPVQYRPWFRLKEAAHGPTTSASLIIYASQEFTHVNGGEVPVPDHQCAEYGTQIHRVISPATGDALLLDPTFLRTEVGQVRPDVVISGETTRTVRIVPFGRTSHLALGEAAQTALDVTVDRD